VITPVQFERWKDFSIRMARTCFKHKRRPSAKEIEENVADYFDLLDENDLASIVNWDHCDPYPVGHPYYSRTYRCPCWHCHGVKKHDCGYKCEEGHIYDYPEAAYPCDVCTEKGERWNPYYWHDLSESEHDRREEQFVSPVTCCIRAGLDVAVSASMGVIGFSAGDIRRMYPEGVPDWFTGGEDKRWEVIPIKAVSAIGFIPGEPELNGTFASLPDNASVWL
jgi:hypothetical protein